MFSVKSDNKIIKSRFLPNKFKKVGAFIILGCFVTILILQITKPISLESDKETIKTIIKTLMIMGLAIIVWSRDKIEDEYTQLIRLKSLGYAFFSGVIYVVIYTFIDLISGDNNLISARYLVGWMLIIYLITYHTNKDNR